MISKEGSSKSGVTKMLKVREGEEANTTVHQDNCVGCLMFELKWEPCLANLIFLELLLLVSNMRCIAENVKRFIRDGILFRHGARRQWHSDHATKLLGLVVITLANTHSAIRICKLAGGYWPMGNSMIEPFWAYFDICASCWTSLMRIFRY